MWHTMIMYDDIDVVNECNVVYDERLKRVVFKF